MQIDYKRDLNHTYVILQEEKEPDTASYQIRMLLTNTIPGLLDCKIGKMDDKTLFYYEVTSKQSLQSVFEQRSIGAEALRKLFEQLLDLLEELVAEAGSAVSAHRILYGIGDGILQSVYLFPFLTEVRKKR